MAPNFSPLTRQTRLAELSDRPLDLIVIGGGITGAGIAWEAAMRGLSVVVLEKNDFASGTSSKSSKLLHGGLRYLEQAEIKLVFESLAQRNRLFEDAPHVAKRLDFLFPIFKGGRDKGPIIGAGLTGYDMLSWLSNRRATRWHDRLSKDEALRVEPHLKREGLVSAYRYMDGLTEDARLVIETLKSAEAAGAMALNYVAVTALAKDAEGRIEGVEAEDTLTGKRFTLKAGCVFNATGPWADALLRMDDATTPRRLRPTKGVHILTEAFVSDHAVVMRSTNPNEKSPRILFVIPWGGRTMIGTTDTAHEGDPDDLSYLDDDVNASADEVQYLLDTVNQSFDVTLTTQDVISSFAGWRPLVAPPDPGKPESAISREYEIFASPSGMLTIAGGKLTAYRTMAAHSVERVIEVLQRLAPQRNFPPGRIETSALSGSELGGRSLEAYLQEALTQSPDLPASLVTALVRRYGTNWPRLRALMAADASLTRLIPGLDEDMSYYMVEVIYAVSEEGAVTVADVLSRRTRLHLLDTRQATQAADAVGALMAAWLGQAQGWSAAEQEAWAHAQATAYREGVEARRQARNTAA
jgi:glycerol-3-phosphate dehydrogenase